MTCDIQYAIYRVLNTLHYRVHISYYRSCSGFPMFSTVCSLVYTLYSIFYILYTVPCTPHALLHIMSSILYYTFYILCTLYSILYTLCAMLYIVYRAYTILYIACCVFYHVQEVNTTYTIWYLLRSRYVILCTTYHLPSCAKISPETFCTVISYQSSASHRLQNNGQKYWVLCHWAHEPHDGRCPQKVRDNCQFSIFQPTVLKMRNLSQ